MFDLKRDCKSLMVGQKTTTTTVFYCECVVFITCHIKAKWQIKCFTERVQHGEFFYRFWLLSKFVQFLQPNSSQLQSSYCYKCHFGCKISQVYGDGIRTRSLLIGSLLPQPKDQDATLLKYSNLNKSFLHPNMTKNVKM